MLRLPCMQVPWWCAELLQQQEQKQEQVENLSTPHELFYGVALDYRILFLFGCLGYYCWRYFSDGKDCPKFMSQTYPDIALGRSDFSNAMIFYDPITSKFITSADYKLDMDRELPSVFPNLIF